MTVKEIRKALMTPGTTFQAPNKWGEMVEFICNPRFKVNDEVGGFEELDLVSSISRNTSYYHDGMNVEKFGPTCVWLYTFDMFSNKIIGKIKYSEVVIIKIGK
jgi:hypothetical protein